ncbi:single-stranded DNA-binding protein [Rhodococcus xishaensis]|uniref:Single-stranded DNA-binding protein n=1 Tax=Rhodococcus xishaensis TaxID=2487364 RepID=A0A3S3ADJ0_9NOCA|nr:single-stranded DNA-binding protein [Rhodococcus xishaensis]RVW05476.1 single-stranded DNA-binding protein [Rhodococcus xishaensis]
MYETHAAVIGTVITDPVKRETASGEAVMSFRMASNVRRRDRESGDWVDGGTLYLTVSCWRRLVQGVGASLMKGDPIIAYGELRTNEYRTRDGDPRTDLEMRASAVGPDLARCSVRVDRSGRLRVGSSSDEAAVEAAAVGEAATCDRNGHGSGEVADKDVDEGVASLTG